MTTALPVELLPIAALRDHPRNYRQHPADQIEHLAESIRSRGFYRNVVVARENTILAGHGVVQAATSLGLTEVPAVRLDLDPLDPRALKVLTGDNEVLHLGEVDDRALSELLKEIKDSTEGLLGTGYDEMMLANLVMVTRPAGEIADFDEAAEWVGLPEMGEPNPTFGLSILFPSEEERAAFVESKGIPIFRRGMRVWQTRWPPEEGEKPGAFRIEG